MNTNVPADAALVVDYDVAMEVASHEAIIRQAYEGSHGIWTWSVGLTSATGHVVERYIGKPQSLEHCLSVYVWALDNYADAAEGLRGRRAFKVAVCRSPVVPLEYGERSVRPHGSSCLRTANSRKRRRFS